MENKPNIRFKGFTDDWEQRKLSDCAGFRRGSFPQPYGNKDWYDGEGAMPFVQVADVSDDMKLVDDTKQKISKLAQPMSVCAEEGSVLVTLQGSIGRVAITQYKAFVDRTVLIFDKYNADIDITFWAYIIKEKFIEEARKAPGGTIKTITKEVLSDFDLMLPSYDEQKMLGKLLHSLDHLITLHQRQCDDIKQLKKYMLQKMFPRKDQNVPEIRFDGFSDDWEQRKLGDWGDFYYGRSCPKWSVTEDATIPCIRYGELYTKFGAKIDRVYSYTNMPPENLRFSKGTEVLIPRVGEDPMDYNHCTWLSMQGVAIGEMISVFNTDNNPLFTATMFNATLQNEFAMRVEGGSVTNLYFEKLKNIDVSFPSIPEQEKIAAYFESLDNLITLRQHKCNQLKELKKYMLSNMFSKKGE